ncbi:MAG: hypothetical protein KY469_17475 [Actinobacteria bacterium]|nr:hypothetical protein [Actinomycetota bacterium]
MPNLRAWILRRLARRLRIGEDILSHLSSFQRLGEHLEIASPQEMLPVGARTVVRALRSRAAPEIRPDWLWPYWLERQHDPTSPAFIPRGHLAFTQNLTQRNWTAVGNIASPWEAIVDPRGLVTPWYDGWSLDWWVDDDGWRFPSREDGVTQELLSGTPVTLTTLPLRDGALVQRVSAQVHDGEWVAVELENASTRGRSVAVALRPYNPEGLAVVTAIAVEGRHVLLTRDTLAMVLPREPERVALSTFHQGDSRHVLEQGLARGAGRLAVHDPAGLAQAAFVYDLEPGEVLRVAIPLVPGIEQASARSLRERVQPVRVTPPVLRPAAEVAAGWSTPLRRGMQVDLPDERLQRAVDANRAHLLVLHDPGAITPGPFTYHRFWFRDAAYMLLALDRWGFHEEAADVLDTFPARQRGDGFFYSQWREWDANGAAIFALAEHHRLTGDETILRRTARSVARGGRWIERMRLRGRGVAPEVEGLLPAGISAEHLGPFDYYYWDDFWSLRGLIDAAYVARVIGDERVADDFDRAAASLRADTLASIERAAKRLGQHLITAGPTRAIDPGIIGSLVACEPLRLLEADDPLIDGTLEVVRDRFTLGPAFYQGISHTGLGTYLTIQLALCELEQGDPRAWERLRWLLDAATPTFTWPEAIHPQLDGGCMGDGHHGWAAAEFLTFVRQVLVREGRDVALHLLGVLPDEWRGHDLAVRKAPTHHGALSYELRWDGDVPVLSWEAERPGVRLRAPSLDPAWTTTEQRGEVKLPSPD